MRDVLVSRVRLYVCMGLERGLEFEPDLHFGTWMAAEPIRTVFTFPFACFYFLIFSFLFRNVRPIGTKRSVEITVGF
jgi:hypothetical protein